MASEDDFVFLNVGGVRFVTTKQTLTSSTDSTSSSFFTALLSGSFKTSKDREGYLLIDRNPKKFEVILEYLRTGRLDVPSDICLYEMRDIGILLICQNSFANSSYFVFYGARQSLASDGEYYGLAGFVRDAKAKLQESPWALTPPRLRTDGTYSKHSGKECLMFLPNGQVYRGTAPPGGDGDSAEAQLLGATFASAAFPEDWTKGDDHVKRMLAMHSAAHLSTGTYETHDGNMVTTTLGAHLKLGLVTWRDRIITFSDAKYHVYFFHPFQPEHKTAAVFVQSHPT